MLFCNVNNLSPCGGYQYLHYKMIEVMYDDDDGDDDVLKTTSFLEEAKKN